MTVTGKESKGRESKLSRFVIRFKSSNDLDKKEKDKTFKELFETIVSLINVDKEECMLCSSDKKDPFDDTIFFRLFIMSFFNA